MCPKKRILLHTTRILGRCDYTHRCGCGFHGLISQILLATPLRYNNGCGYKLIARAQNKTAAHFTRVYDDMVLCKIGISTGAYFRNYQMGAYTRTVLIIVGCLYTRVIKRQIGTSA